MRFVGTFFSRIKDTVLHAGLAVFWTLMIIPTLMFWSDSVAVVLIYSVYALMAAHFAAYEGAKNDDKLDKVISLLESMQVKCYTEEMTYYKRSNEQQRNDPLLKELIGYELSEMYELLDDIKDSLQEALELLDKASCIERNLTDGPSDLLEAKAAIKLAIHKFGYKPDNDTYIGNIAAYLTEDQIKKLKEAYMIEEDS